MDRGLLVLLELRRDADDGCEQEERQAGREEQVAERGDVLDDRDGDRDDVAKDERPHEEVGGLARHDDVQRAGHVLRRQAGGLQARGPDRHVAAVEHDDQPVEQDADERDAETRVEPVDPQADQEENEPGRQQRGPQHLDDVDAAR